MSPCSLNHYWPTLGLEELLEDQTDLLNNAKISVHLGLENSNVLVDIKFSLNKKEDVVTRSPNWQLTRGRGNGTQSWKWWY